MAVTLALAREKSALTSFTTRPLPTGYIDAVDVAQSRLRRKWSNIRCPKCHIYGWRPGQITDVDIRVPAQIAERNVSENVSEAPFH